MTPVVLEGSNSERTLQLIVVFQKTCCDSSVLRPRPPQDLLCEASQIEPQLDFMKPLKCFLSGALCFLLKQHKVFLCIQSLKPGPGPGPTEGACPPGDRKRDTQTHRFDTTRERSRGRCEMVGLFLLSAAVFSRVSERQRAAFTYLGHSGSVRC